MNERDKRGVLERDGLVEKLRKIKAISLQLFREDIPQVQNNMEIVLCLVDELLFLFDEGYKRP